jgi:hypothetical protein
MDIICIACPGPARLLRIKNITVDRIEGPLWVRIG